MDVKQIYDLCDKIKERIQALGMQDYVLYATDYCGDFDYDEIEEILDSLDYAHGLNFYLKDVQIDPDSGIVTYVREIDIVDDKLIFCVDEVGENYKGTESIREFEETIDYFIAHDITDGEQIISCLKGILEYAFGDDEQTKPILDLNKRRYEEDEED